jgi:hypothetical protein
VHSLQASARGAGAGGGDSKLDDAADGDASVRQYSEALGRATADSLSGGVHDPARPILFREFLELLVRIARARYAGADPSPLVAEVPFVLPPAPVSPQKAAGVKVSCCVHLALRCNRPHRRTRGAATLHGRTGSHVSSSSCRCGVVWG